MGRQTELIPEFIKLAPAEIKEGILYISMEYGSAIHKCCCGCGEKVVTPLGPTDWKLTFDGDSVSLYPSIGNWSLRCQSHYWIKNNKVLWAERWSRERIEAGRAYDRVAKDQYFGRTARAEEKALPTHTVRPQVTQPEESFWQKVKRWLLR